MKFFKTPALIKLAFRECIWKIPAKEKVIYLTFDDGPQPGLTEYILETLKKYQAKATFFCVGENITKYPDLAQLILDEGHEIANHTFNHLQGWKTSLEDYFKNIDFFESSAAEQLQDFKSTKLFRPPHGQLTLKQKNRLKKLGFHIVMWDILSYDFVKDLDREHALKQITRSTSRGSIALFHDNYKAENNLKYLLPEYLDYFAEKNYRFAKVGDGLLN